jgi:actin-related protein 2
MADKNIAVICDTGTGMVKAGWAGHHEPCCEFPTIIGRPALRYDQGLSGGPRLSDIVVGSAAVKDRSMLNLSRPIADGIVQNWDDLETIWSTVFEEMNVDTNGKSIVQTEAAMNPKKNRERIVETMFEKYGFGRVNVSIQAILALYSQGLTTGIVVDAGDGVTHLVPVYEGYLEPTLVHRINLAGRHVTEHLTKLLVGAGHPLNAQADQETVREVKQRLCYVAHDIVKERKLATETTLVDKQYTLPDSRTMRVSTERFEAPEIMFTPPASVAGDGKGIADAVFETIRKAGMDVQKSFFSHILLSGGTTMFPGFSTRLEKDVRQLYLQHVLKGDVDRLKKFKCNVEDPPQRNHMVFLGASISAFTNTLDSPWWLSRQEYQDVGPSAVNRLIPTKLS